MSVAPLVSVLMSNYKTPPLYLRRAIESVLCQTLGDFEVVAINDGVYDESFSVLTEYAKQDSRIVLIENPENMGLAVSLNRGLDACRGKYVARMDTDDICYPDRLEKQVAFMEAHPHAIVSGAWADVFEEDETITKKEWRPTMCSQDEYHIRLLFANDPLIIHPTAIFSRALLESNHLRYDTDLRYRYTEDYRMWVKCSRIADVEIMEYPVLKYRDANVESRITVRHAEGMQRCNYEVQREQYGRLGMDLTEEQYQRYFRLLAGRKEYDIAYKEWMNRIMAQNRAAGIYDEDTMRTLFHERWYNIVYYAIAYEKSLVRRVKYFASLYRDGKIRFIKEMAGKVRNQTRI